MKSLNDSDQKNVTSDEKHLVEMARKYFQFLVEQYKLVYKRTNERSFAFTLKKVRIELMVGHKTPRIYVYRLGEPDFTGLPLETIIRYFESKLPKINFEFHPLEYNIKFMAKVLRDRAHKLIEEINDWWIPVQLYRYRTVEQSYKEGLIVYAFDGDTYMGITGVTNAEGQATLRLPYVPSQKSEKVVVLSMEPASTQPSSVKWKHWGVQTSTWKFRT